MSVVFGRRLLLGFLSVGGGFGCCCWGYVVRCFFLGKNCIISLGEPWDLGGKVLWVWL